MNIKPDREKPYTKWWEDYPIWGFLWRIKGFGFGFHYVGNEICLLPSPTPLFSIDDMYLRRRRKKSLTMSHIVPSVTTGSFSRGIREVGGICWDLLAQGIVALDLTLVMSWLQPGNVTAAFCPAWNCRVMDAERQEHFKLFSERPFSAPSMLVFWVWFSKQTALCLG